LLPLFPPGEKVQDMKEHLCDCLNDYHNKIQHLKKELEDHSTSAENLRKQHRKQKHKHITINPSQMCDLCFKPIFDREFYVFPCQHAFHRMCIQNRLANYDTKDVRVRVIISKVKACFEHIEAVKKNALEISTQRSAFQPGAAVQGRDGAAGSMYDTERSQSYLNDITSLAGGLIQRGANLINQSQVGRGGSLGGINQQQMFMLKEKEERQIRDKLKEVDEILTRECFFCGGILIDMIDNYIEIKEEEAFDLEDMEPEEDKANASAPGYGQQQKVNLLEDEWDIE